MDLCANVDCPPPGECQAAITCNPATGLCDAALKANGTACDDGVACTEQDVCGGGVCAGLPITCPPNASCVAGQCVAPACTGNLGLPGPPRFQGGDVRAALDLDADGVVDAFTLGGDAAFVWSGDGAGFFKPTNAHVLGGAPTGARAADVDGNGSLDVVVGNASAAKFSIVRDDASKLDVGGLVGPPVVVVPADFALSPLPDVVYFTAAGDYGIAVNDGNLAFTHTALGALGAPPRDAVAADFNGDGKNDIAVATSDGLRVLTGTGAAFIANVFGAGTSFTSVDAVDLDGDGKKDLAATSPTGAVIVQNTGVGFVVVNTISLLQVDGVRAADMDGDNKVDLVLRGTCTDVGCGPGLNDNVSVLLNTGSFGFSTLGLTERAAGPGSLVVADIDGDQHRDVLVSGGATITPLLQDGTGLLPGAPALALPGTAAIGTGDFDGDGHVDFALSRHPIGPGAYNTVEIFESNGQAIVPGPVSLGTDSTAPAPTGLASADVDGDGHVDVILVGPDNALRWMRNTNASGTFGDLKDVGLFDVPRAFDVSDLGGDGDVDVAIASTSMGVLLVEDLGGAAAVSAVQVGANPVAIASGDIDGDGDRDLLVGLEGGGLAVLRNDGAAWSATTIATFATPTAVVAADVDADGHVDVVLATASSLSVLFGDGAGGFVEGMDVPGAGVGAATATSVLVADVDTDGLPDLLAVSDGRDDATLLRHTGPRVFGPGERYGVSSNPSSVVTMDVDLDARPDVVVLAEKFVNVLPARCAP